MDAPDVEGERRLDTAEGWIWRLPGELLSKGSSDSASARTMPREAALELWNRQGPVSMSNFLVKANCLIKAEKPLSLILKIWRETVLNLIRSAI